MAYGYDVPVYIDLLLELDPYDPNGDYDGDAVIDSIDLEAFVVALLGIN